MKETLAEIAMAAGALGFLAFIIAWASKRHRTGRDKRRFLRRYLWALLLSCGAVSAAGWARGNVAMGLAWAAMPFAYVWLALRRPVDEEAQLDFALDSRHCGQCGYDLTGNVSGVCPECGWTIPERPMRLERPDWGMWWRQWQIDYLRRPWQRLAAAGIFAVVLLGMAVWSAVFMQSVFAVLPAVLGVCLGIQVIRIVSYIKREHEPRQEEESPGRGGDLDGVTDRQPDRA